MTVHNWGENPSGQWTLSVTDNEASSNNREQRAEHTGRERGRLLEWSMTLYGISGERNNHNQDGGVSADTDNNDGASAVKKPTEEHRSRKVDRTEVENLMAKEVRSSETVQIKSEANRKKSEAPSETGHKGEHSSAEEHFTEGRKRENGGKNKKENGPKEETEDQEDKDFHFLRRLYEIERQSGRMQGRRDDEGSELGRRNLRDGQVEGAPTRVEYGNEQNVELDEEEDIVRRILAILQE